MSITSPTPNPETDAPEPRRAPPATTGGPAPEGSGGADGPDPKKAPKEPKPPKPPKVRKEKAPKAPKGDKGEGDEPKKKSKVKLIIILVVVLGLGGFVEKGKFITPHYRPGQVAPNGPTFALDQLTVNLSDGHLVQATIVMQLTTAASSKTITADQPQFEDAAISVLGAETYPGLISPGGRDAVKTELLGDFQKITGPSEGSPQVSAVYFTGFVIQ